MLRCHVGFKTTVTGRGSGSLIRLIFRRAAMRGSWQLQSGKNPCLQPRKGLDLVRGCTIGAAIEPGRRLQAVSPHPALSAKIQFSPRREFR